MNVVYGILGGLAMLFIGMPMAIGAMLLIVRLWMWVVWLIIGWTI